MKDLLRLMQVLTGASRDVVMRKVQLMRNPEGSGDVKRCPVCKKPVYTNEHGDTFCENFSLDYETIGRCFWHRWKDGTNYWSDPMQKVIQKIMKRNQQE